MTSDVSGLTGPILEVLSGDLAGRSYEIDEQEFYIGRATSCDLVIPKRYISREHAKIVRHDQGFVIDGLSEKNPVLLGNRPARGTALQDGDVFEVCGIQFRFKREGRIQRRKAGNEGHRMSGGSSEDAGAGADGSWVEADTQQWNREPSGDGFVSGGGDLSDSRPRRLPPSESGPVSRGSSRSRRRDGPSDSGPVSRGGGDSRPSDSGSVSSDFGASAGARSGARPEARSKRVVFEVEDDARNPSADSASGDIADATAINEQTAELGKADPDDPDYDPFADVEVQKKKKTVDPGREKALKAMLGVGAVGLAFASFFLWKITTPKDWTSPAHPVAIKLAVDEVQEFSYGWAMEDPPQGRAGISLEGRPYLVIDDDYAYVEWAAPHITSRSIFLIKGKAEGQATFWLTFPNSRRRVSFNVEIEGEPIHEVFRQQRSEEWRSTPPRELRREIEKLLATGEQLTEERAFDGKEGYYRQALEEFQAATDVGIALQSILADKGVVAKRDQDLVLKCEEREKQALQEYNDFVQRELALYRKSVQQDGRPEQIRRLRRVLRAIQHSCDLEYNRLHLILTEFHETAIQGQVPTCQAAGGKK